MVRSATDLFQIAVSTRNWAINAHFDTVQICSVSRAGAMRQSAGIAVGIVVSGEGRKKVHREHAVRCSDMGDCLPGFCPIRLG